MATDPRVISGVGQGDTSWGCSSCLQHRSDKTLELLTPSPEEVELVTLSDCQTLLELWDCVTLLLELEQEHCDSLNVCV